MNERNNKIISICEKYNVIEIYSFGSRAMEIVDFLNLEISEMKESSSDIDIGVRFKKGYRPDIEMKVRLAIELEDFFRCAKVDLVQLETAPPFLALDIIRGELLYAEDPDDQARYELFVMARAGDLMIFEKERRNNVLSSEKK